MLEELYDKPEDTSTQTVIQNRYTFWCHKRGKQTATNYEEAMKQVGNFQTIEHFWRIYNHMLRPSEFKTTTDYHLFKHGIKPTWEDPQNERGGKWMVRLKKGLSTRYWEELIIAIIGEQFDVGHEICGAVVSVRNNEDIISVWNKNAENTEAKNKIRDQMRRILKLPSFINVEYKKHQDSIVDKSSFRNTVVWRSESNNDRGPRKPRTEWGDRNDHSGNERHHGHRHEQRPHHNKDSAAHEYSPRTGGGSYSSRYNGDKDKDKDKDSTSSHRTWQQATGNTSGSTWKSPRSNFHAKEGSTGTSTASPRNTSAWSTGSSSKPSPASTPSASAGGGSGWLRGDASKTDGSAEKSVESPYVPLGGSKQQGGASHARPEEQRNRGGSGGGSSTENVWGRVKKE